jgi:DNA-binding beta-propeller fold protein YncE
VLVGSRRADGTEAAGTLTNDVAIDPSGRYVYVPNTLNNNVSLYTIGTGGALARQTPATVGAGASTRNIATTGAYR